MQEVVGKEKKSSDSVLERLVHREKMRLAERCNKVDQRNVGFN